MVNNSEKKLNGTVIVTYRCNARCSMCNRYKAPSKPEEEISLGTIKKLPKMYFTNITGGEPFIRTDLKDIVRELYKKKAIKRHNYMIMSVALLLAIYSFCESQMLEVYSSFVYFYLIADDIVLDDSSILVTNVAGALELLNVTEQDVIYDPMDENEIAGKIDYLLQHPNNERLMKNLDFEKISYKAEVERLEQFCRKLSGKAGVN